MNEQLDKLYSKPELPGSFGGINALQRVIKGKSKANDIKKWLEKKESYNLHKPLKRNFKKNRVIVGGINEQFQADLVDLKSLAKYNNNFKYLLTCIDVFSKYAWAIPLKDKLGNTILKAFKKIFKQRKPEKLQTDSGTEFKNKIVQSYLKKEQIHFFTTHNQTKASVVERFNRTLKTKMWKYFTEYNTRRYLDVLGKLMLSYNHSFHRSIKTEPASVTTVNQRKVWQTLYGDLHMTGKSEVKFSVGDTVRVSKEKGHFEKGYEQNWTRELFTISHVIPRNPTVYKIKDLMGEDIKGTFYDQELQKVVNSGFYPVEKIIKKRKKGGRIEYLVKFLGYPDKFNDWVTDVKLL